MDKVENTSSLQGANTGGTTKNYVNGRIDSQKTITGSDPRIDSPEIEVVYPSIQDDRPRFTEVHTETETDTETEAPTCDCEKQKTDWLTAIRENGTPFLLIALLLLVIGYALGRRQG